jgi:hypothetical protein
MSVWRKVSGAVVALVGVVFIVSILVNNLFEVGPAFERMADNFRPVMQEETIAALEQDLAGLSAVGEEFQTVAVPALSQALGVTPEEFVASMQTQFPAVATGMEQLSAVVEDFQGVVATLEAELERFDSADAIPTDDLAAYSVPWAMLIAGIALIALGIWIFLTKGSGAPIAAIVVAALLVVMPFVLSLPQKAADADQMNENLKPVYTAELVSGAQQGLQTIGAMGQQMQEEMLPALGAQLGMDEAALNAFLGENLPSIAQAMQTMPDAMERFTAVVDTFAQSLEDYQTINEVAFVPIVWTIIVGGAIALIAAIVGLVVGRRTPAGATA